MAVVATAEVADMVADMVVAMVEVTVEVAAAVMDLRGVPLEMGTPTLTVVLCAFFHAPLLCHSR
jgi:hypothetical protein